MEGRMSFLKKNKNFILYLVSLIVAVAIGGFGTYLFLRPYVKGDKVTNITKTEKEVTVVDTGIGDAVEKVYDSVVVVETFVRNQLYSTGTGFIYKHSDNHYYLLTNYHVIDGGTAIKIVFTDGKEVDVKVVGGDRFADIAVLSYETDADLKVSEIGKSVDMRVGDTVFAIGAPLDSSVYSWSVTRGVLSGKDREVEVKVTNSTTSDWIMNVLQTDAAINSGNSGGPLCNSNGQVIGITNMKLVTDGVEGMGFAIPIEEASTYANAIINGEDISRPILGIGMYDVSSIHSSTIKSGVGINRVDPNSPAEKAGLRQGDIIIGMDNKEITSVAQFRVQLYSHKIGDTFTIRYYRDGKSDNTTVNLFKYTDS